METTVKLKVVVAEKETTDGRKFKAYKTFSKNGRATELKFRKEVQNVPTKNCYIVCNVDDVNVNTSGEYPVCWVKAIQSVEDLDVVNVELNRQKVTDYFG